MININKWNLEVPNPDTSLRSPEDHKIDVKPSGKDKFCLDCNVNVSVLWEENSVKGGFVCNVCKKKRKQGVNNG